MNPSLIFTALEEILDEGRISQDKFSDVLFELIGVFRQVIKVSILPSSEFVEACKAAVERGDLFRFMSNPKTCRTVSQVSLDLAYNNLLALYGIYSSDPEKITKGILGLTNTTAGIWADNIDLVADIGQTNAKIRGREAQTIVFEYASDYWSSRAREESPYPPEYRDGFLTACYDEVVNVNEVQVTPSFWQWLLRLHDSADLRGTVDAFCHNEYVRWKEFIDVGKYEALLVAVARGDRAGYNELVSKWFHPNQSAQYGNMWSALTKNSELENAQTKSYFDHYQRAIDAGFLEGSAARALFGAGNPATFPLLASIFTSVNEIDPESNDTDEFFNCYRAVNDGRSPTYDDFATCMIRGLNLSVNQTFGEVTVKFYGWTGVSNYSPTDAFLKSMRIVNGPQGNDLGTQMSEYDLVRFGGRLRDSVVLGERLLQQRIENKIKQAFQQR